MDKEKKPIEEVVGSTTERYNSTVVMEAKRLVLCLKKTLLLKNLFYTYYLTDEAINKNNK